MLDGRIVSGSRDHTLRVWHINDSDSDQGGSTQGMERQGQGLGQEQGYGTGQGSEQKLAQGLGLGLGLGQGLCERVLVGHKGSVTCVTPLIDPPTHICSGSNDHTLKVCTISVILHIF